MTRLDDMWAELKQTTKGYRQMVQPLPVGTRWYNAEQIYKELSAQPVPKPSIGSIGGMFLTWIEIDAGFATAHPYDFLILRSDARDKVDFQKLRAGGTKIFGYINMSGSRLDATAPHPSTIPKQLVDGSPDWLLGPTFWGGDLRLLDVGNQAYQDAWAAYAVSDNKGILDGIFIDDCNTGLNFRGAWSSSCKYTTDASWNAATESFLSRVCPQLKNAGLLALPNFGSQWNDDQAMMIRWGKLAGSYFKEHYMKWRDSDTLFTTADAAWIEGLHQAMTNVGIPFYACTRGKLALTDIMHTCRATFLKHHDSFIGGGYAWSTMETPDAGKDPFNAAWAYN